MRKSKRWQEPDTHAGKTPGFISQQAVFCHQWQMVGQACPVAQAHMFGKMSALRHKLPDPRQTTCIDMIELRQRKARRIGQTTRGLVFIMQSVIGHDRAESLVPIVEITSDQQRCIISNMHARGDQHLDYVVVLGAQVRKSGPSKALRYRLDTAADYLRNSPDTICIVSGGKGPNEPFPEAQGMADYLKEHGIDEQRILEEPDSKTTEENIVNSKKLMRQENASVGIVTNDFHMFRALQIAHANGLKQAQGIAASSPKDMLVNNMVREFFAEIKFLFS